MKTRPGILWFLSLLLLGSCKVDPTILEALRVTARADFYAMLSDIDTTFSVDQQIYFGSATFIQEDSFVTLTIDLEHFSPNSIHAVHLHEGTCPQPGAHWNQGREMTDRFCNTRSLGLPWAKPMAGDVGNVSVGYDGTGSLTIKTDLWRLNSSDSLDIAGKVIVVHENFEDFASECNPLHGHNHPHANAKIACGTILLQ